MKSRHLSSVPAAAGDKAPSSQPIDAPVARLSVQWMKDVGRERLSHYGGLLRRRARYIARFAYYAAVHRGFRNVRWALAHEGTTWN